MRVLLLAAASVLPLLGAPDARTSSAFNHFYNLEYDQAIALFTQLANEEPSDPERHNHLAQAILYKAMFLAGALESELVTGNNSFLRRDKVNPSPEDKRLFDAEIGKALALCGERLKANPDDIPALYMSGVAHGLRANYNFLVRKAWMDALKEATAARKAHNRVTKLNPKFVDARLVQGVHDYVVGSLPFGYKLLGFLAGFRGDRQAGIRTLEEVARNGDLNKADAEVLLAAIYRREKRPNDAIPLVEDLLTRFPRNYLLQFELSRMYADLGNKEAALGALKQIEDRKRGGAPGYQHLSWEKIYYHRGNLHFWYDDLRAAAEDLQKAASKAEDLDLSTGILSWMRLGQTYDLQGRRREAEAAYRNAITMAPDSELARESKKYLNSPYRREKTHS